MDHIGAVCTEIGLGEDLALRDKVDHEAFKSMSICRMIHYVAVLESFID